MKITITKDEKTSLELVGFCAILVFLGGVFGWFIQPTCLLPMNASVDNNASANNTSTVSADTCLIGCSTVGKVISSCDNESYACGMFADGSVNIVPLELRDALRNSSSIWHDKTAQLLDKYCERQTVSGTDIAINQMDCERPCTFITSVDGSSWLCRFSLG